MALALGYIILIIAGSLFLAMTLIWLISIAIMNPTIVDVWWSSGIAITMASYLLASNAYQSLGEWSPSGLWPKILSLIFIAWALRLTVFILFTRIMKRHTDERYGKMEASWQRDQANIYLRRFLAFQFQSLLQFLLVTPFVISSYYILYDTENLNLTIEIPNGGLISAYIFAGLGFFSVLGQWQADYQVYRFAQEQLKIRAENLLAPRLICKTGLWSYSRHPNYFFEMMIWVAYCWVILSVTISIYSYTNFWSILILICPILPVLLMFIIFRFITGPITENQSLGKRPVLYKEYIENVPMIFPFLKWPNFISNMEPPAGS